MTGSRSRAASHRFASGFARLLPAVVALALILLVVALEWNGIPGQPYRDTLAYQRAATQAAHGESIYDPLPAPGPHEFEGVWYYLYPPPLAALLSFLPETDHRTFDRGWLLLSLLAFCALAASLARIALGRWDLRSAGRWGLALLVVPGFVLGMHFGNIEPAVLALVGLGLAVPALAGFLLGIAAAVKVTPVAALLVLAVRRPRRVLPSLAVAVLLCAGASLAVFGVSGTVGFSGQWLRDVAPVVGQGQFWGGSLTRLHGHLTPPDYLGNLSVSFLPVQLVVLKGWWGYAGGELPTGVRLWLAAFQVGIPLLVARWLRGRSPTLQATGVLTAAMLAAPIVRPYALPVLLMLGAAYRHDRRHLAPDSLAGRQEHEVDAEC